MDKTIQPIQIIQKIIFKKSFPINGKHNEVYNLYSWSCTNSLPL